MSEIRNYFDLHTGILEVVVDQDVSYLREATDLGSMLTAINASELSKRPIIEMRLRALPDTCDLPSIGGERRKTHTGITVASDSRRPDGPWVIIDDKVGLRLLDSGKCEILADTRSEETPSALTNALIFALSHTVTGLDGSLLHGACLLTPSRDGIVILQAPSGTGKTTTAMALALAGFAIAGDDTTCLIRETEDNGSITAWGVPRAAKVHRKTVAMLPELAELVCDTKWNGEGEQAVERYALIEAGLGAVAERPLPIKAVILLTKPESDADIEPSLKTRFDALKKLLEDNLSAGAEGFFPTHDDLFTTLSELVAKVPTLRVPVNGPPKDVASRIASTVAAL
ncbi:MAG: hypothetical protein AAFP80_02545 [Pseudomonadota bacterium]